MIDVKFTQDSYGRFDFEIENGDLKSEDGYDTSIWISLLTDARANASQIPIPEHRRGWLGNLVSIVPDRQLGGYLWLVDQRRMVQKTLNEAIDYAKKSLQWMIDDNICTDIVVTGKFVPKFGIELDVDISSDRGIIVSKNIKLWELTGR
jgi:phage gp46-like protein